MNGRAHGQIKIGQGSKTSFGPNKNAVQTIGLKNLKTPSLSANGGKISKGVTVTSTLAPLRNSMTTSEYSVNAGQTMGIGKASVMRPRSGAKNSKSGHSARVAASVSQRNSTDYRIYARGTDPTVGLKGAKLGTTLGTAPMSKISRTPSVNELASSRSTIGLKGAQNGNAKAGTTGTNLRKSPTLGNRQALKSASNCYQSCCKTSS